MMLDKMFGGIVASAVAVLLDYRKPYAIDSIGVARYIGFAIVNGGLAADDVFAQSGFSKVCSIQRKGYPI